VVDPATGTEAPSGTPGELLVRGYTVRDGYWENPVAFVVREDGDDIPSDTLLRRMQGRIASFKIPRHAIFVEAFPTTPSGQVRKVELRAEARRQLG
jgi:acyl-CoA synthetase (AMP-forming)/AMP-acid ligase II